MKHRPVRLIVLFTAALSLLFFTPGCDDNDEYDHNPPTGMGSLVVDNWTSEDIGVYVNGEKVGEVNDGDDKSFDFAPGVYRVVLVEDDGDRRWANEVDILMNKLTVLVVTIDLFDEDEYNVSMDID